MHHLRVAIFVTKVSKFTLMELTRNAKHVQATRVRMELFANLQSFHVKLARLQTQCVPHALQALRSLTANATNLAAAANTIQSILVFAIHVPQAVTDVSSRLPSSVTSV